MAGVTDMEKWIAVGTLLDIRIKSCGSLLKNSKLCREKREREYKTEERKKDSPIYQYTQMCISSHLCVRYQATSHSCTAASCVSEHMDLLLSVLEHRDGYHRLQ